MVMYDLLNAIMNDVYKFLTEFYFLRLHSLGRLVSCAFYLGCCCDIIQVGVRVIEQAL